MSLATAQRRAELAEAVFMNSILGRRSEWLNTYPLSR
jgi:hypothetical protein